MFSGGISDRVPPGHMPNPEVKPVSADGTVWGTYGRVGHCQKTVERRARSPGTIPGLLAHLSSSHFVPSRAITDEMLRHYRTIRS